MCSVMARGALWSCLFLSGGSMDGSERRWMFGLAYWLRASFRGYGRMGCGSEGFRCLVGKI